MLKAPSLGLLLLLGALPVFQGCAAAPADTDSVGKNAARLSLDAQLITDWDKVTVDAVRTAVPPLSPPYQMRFIAIAEVSVMEAVNAFEQTYDPYAVTASPPAGASEAAAALSAAHHALRTLFPPQAAALDARFNTDLATLPAAGKADGVAFGELVATQIVNLRANDGWNTPMTFTPVAGPGKWVPTLPAFAPFNGFNVPQITPWVTNSNDQFRLGPPYPLTSEEYADDYNEVKARGRATGSTRTADETEYARFWVDSSAVTWHQAARQAVTAAELSLGDAAHVFALMSLAMVDAGGAAWDMKKTYTTWRPISAIRGGDTDGNDATVADPTWTPLVPTPPHPDYCAGHPAYSAAAADILSELFDGQNISLNLTSLALPGVTRHFNSFDAAVDEVVEARITAGIHTRYADTQAVKLGRHVAKFVRNHVYKPSKKLHKLKHAGQSDAANDVGGSNDTDD